LFINKLNAGEFGEGAEETDDIDINEVSNNPIYDEILNGVITEYLKKVIPATYRTR
jgi:hypothetical protein